MRETEHLSQPTEQSLVDDQVLDEAWAWLCRRRKDYPASSDIWWLRQDWVTEKRPKIIAQLIKGHYQFEPLQKLTRSDGEIIELWCARDALVLKALSIVLGQAFEVSPRCTHVKGRGGAKAAVREVAQALSDYRFVFRTDVKSFYASIDHVTVYGQLCEKITDKALRRLLWQYLRRTVECGGLYQEVEKGISLGCPLSPLIGAICLAPLDSALTRKEIFYIRFVDDWVVLAKTRHHLRRAVKITNQVLSDLKLTKHPDKTFIGLITKGFDFLGYYFSPEGLSVAQPTLGRFIEKATRLYEQEQRDPDGQPLLGQYVRRWLAWAHGGLSGQPNTHLAKSFLSMVTLNSAKCRVTLGVPIGLPDHCIATGFREIRH